jgi:hypothetical protein
MVGRNRSGEKLIETPQETSFRLLKNGLFDVLNREMSAMPIY